MKTKRRPTGIVQLAGESNQEYRRRYHREHKRLRWGHEPQRRMKPADRKAIAEMLVYRSIAETAKKLRWSVSLVAMVSAGKR